MGIRKLLIPDGSVKPSRYHSRRSFLKKITRIIPLGIFLICFGSTVSALAGENALIPSYGDGKFELIVFTDYFCPPCQALEADMEPALKNILKAGGVRVTFVDVPIHQFTALYGKYFLYTVNAGAKYKDALHVRNILFALAKNNTITTDEGVANSLRKQRVVFKAYDLKKVHVALDQTMRKYNIRSTPTCVVKYSDTDVNKYIGTDEIKKGLSLLQSRMKKAQR